MKIGDRVIFVYRFSTYRGMRGVVTAEPPMMRVHFDGEKAPVAVWPSEVIPEDEQSVSLTGAE